MHVPLFSLLNLISCYNAFYISQYSWRKRWIDNHEHCSISKRHDNFAMRNIVAINSDAQLLAKNYFDRLNMDFKVISYNNSEWRTHIKLPVQPLSRWGGIKIGLYKPKSIEVEENFLTQHHPRINEGIIAFTECARDAGITGYQLGNADHQADGNIRYIQMNLERSSQAIQLTIVWNAIDVKAAGKPLALLLKKLKGCNSLWHSITVNFNVNEGNAIFNSHMKVYTVS